MERRDLDQIAEEAGFWDARLRAPDCSDVDRSRFAKWRDQAPSHRAEFERLQHIVAMARQSVSRADVRALRDAARQAGARHRWKAPAATAATVALLAVGTGLIVRQAIDWLPNLRASASQPEARKTGEQYETQLGQRSTVILRDGSTVELDAKTLVKVNFTAQYRQLELVYGQALFRVAKNPQRPFVVRAGDREILAMGTEFDVQRDASSVRVTLIEGRVAVSREDLSEGIRVPDSHLASVLEPGQRSVTQEGTGETRVELVDVQQVIGWREGRVTLDDATLADAVAEMNRHSPMQIRIQQSPELASLRVSGVFRAGEQEAFVAALENYFPIVTQRNGDAEIVLSARQAH